MNGLRYLVQRLIESVHRLLYFLLTPFHAIRHFFGGWFARFRYSDDELAAPRSSRPLWLTCLLSPILLPLWVVRRGIPRLLFLTFHPANRKALLLGLPALLIATVALLVLTLSWLYPKERLVGRYERAAYRSFNSANWDRAQIYYEKLCYLEPAEDRYRYLLALVRERKRELAGAYGIMAGAGTAG